MSQDNLLPDRYSQGARALLEAYANVLPDVSATFNAEGFMRLYVLVLALMLISGCVYARYEDMKWMAPRERTQPRAGCL
jgi:hypothetical protein